MSPFAQWIEENGGAFARLGPFESQVLWNKTLDLIASAVEEDASRFGERHHAAVIRGWKV